MATPEFDKELLRLRVRIGDAYRKETGLAFVADPPSLTEGLDKDGNSVTSLELVDIWNTAVKEFIRIMVKSVPRERWGLIVPGYVIHSEDIALTNVSFTYGTTSAVMYCYEKLSAFDPIIHQILALQMIADEDYLTHRNGVYFNPTEFYTICNGENQVSARQTMYTVMTVPGATTTEPSLVVVPPSAYRNSVTTGAPPAQPTTSIQLVYLKRHTNLIQGTIPDLVLEEFAPDTLDMIIVFAEREYMTRRQLLSNEIISTKLTENVQTMGGNKYGVRSEQ